MRIHFWRINATAQKAGTALSGQDDAADKVGGAVALGARMAIVQPDPKEDLFGLVTNHDTEGVKTTDFAPRAWGNMRIFYKIADEEYLQEWDAKHNHRRHEVTPGMKGGKWVVYSKSGKYVAMELTKGESSALAKHTEAFYNYLKSNSETSLLPRIVGHHSADGNHFFVYVNPLAPGLSVAWNSYDVHANGQRTAPAIARGKLNAHLLDRDFMLDHRTVFGTFRDKKKALLHIAQDAAFLAKMGFSDFVLETSVAQFDAEMLPKVKAWASSAKAKGGMYNGIILSPLEDEICVVQLGHCFTPGSDGMKYCQALYNFAKKRVFTSPDPSVADIEYEKWYLETLQKKLQGN